MRLAKKLRFDALNLNSNLRDIIISAYQSHHRLLALAFPLILANVTTPILGLVDTAILGRMGAVHFLAGAAVGSLIITQIYWVCGFIKMSITGLSAQAKGQSKNNSYRVLIQGIVIALILSACLITLQNVILNIGLFFAQAEQTVVQSIKDYFSTRIWGAPAALVNLVLIGWLVGQQNTKMVLYLQIFINLVNIVASLVFVYVFDWGVQGVAAATVFAEYCMLFVAMIFTLKRLSLHISVRPSRSWFYLSSIKDLLSLNQQIFIRNLALQFTLAFITLKGVQYSTEAAAINAILMQFFALIALGLDGIANAVEALVGEGKGRKQVATINHNVKIGLQWSSVLAVAYAIMFWLFGENIVALLTHHEHINRAMSDYWVVVFLLPLVAHWCFLFDGVFVGLGKGQAMRNSMLLSTGLGFLPIWWWFSDLQNISLWIAMLVFLAFRGVILGAYYYYLRIYRPSLLLK